MYTDKIKEIYRNNKKTKQVDLLTPVIFIALISTLFGYLYSNIQKKLLNTDFEDKKCSPKYLFFSGFLNILDKNPWHTTQSNFQKCVAKNIYKDPVLSKDIKQNKYYIRKNEDEIKRNLEQSEKIVDSIKNQKLALVEEKRKQIENIRQLNSDTVVKQGANYTSLGKKTTQLFQVLKSILYYIKHILIFKVSFYKREMEIDNVHNRFMEKYRNIYNTEYKQCFEKLNETQYKDAMNTAMIAKEKYDAMSDEIDLLMEQYQPKLLPLTESCYQLQYNIKDGTCLRLFPKLNPIPIEFYPTIANMVPGK